MSSSLLCPSSSEDNRIKLLSANIIDVPLGPKKNPAEAQMHNNKKSSGHRTSNKDSKHVISSDKLKKLCLSRKKVAKFTQSVTGLLLQRKSAASYVTSISKKNKSSAKRKRFRIPSCLSTCSKRERRQIQNISHRNQNCVPKGGIYYVGKRTIRDVSDVPQYFGVPDSFGSGERAWTLLLIEGIDAVVWCVRRIKVRHIGDREDHVADVKLREVSATLWLVA